MATRSCIAVRTGTARKPRYLAAYCHWDGYPAHQLPILTKDYATPATALTLVAGGDLSSLSSDTDWKHEPCAEGPRYYSERGDQDVGPREFASIQQLIDYYRQCGCEHSYVFVPKQGWVHTDIREEAEEVEPDPVDFNYVGSPAHY
jgi:hypothetical protein